MILLSCNKTKTEFKVEGLKPIYVTENDFYDIKNLSEQKLVNTGSIYLWKNFFLIAEYRKGIHVYDRTNPSNPIYISYLSIPGCVDFTITGQTMFVDNGFDILSINISNILSIKLNTVLKNQTKNPIEKPANYKGYFECVDRDKGYYIGWDSTILVNPKCRTMDYDL
jgi:hypothetical protein